jgi:CRISPR-associated protein Csb1
MPVFPPTYPAPDRRGHRHDTPYTINQDGDGRWHCDIDTVQSQANRMEQVFSGPCADLVPQHAVQAGNHVVRITELAHRVADAAIRASDLNETIHAAFTAWLGRDPQPLARLAPTSFVYGVWDSRDTQAKVPRAIRSEIRATDVAVFTRSAQFSGSFSKEALGLTDQEWRKGADTGVAPAPSVDAHGGVLVHGNLYQRAAIHLGALRRYPDPFDGRFASYLLGLALAGLLEGGRDYDLRSGCWLTPSEATAWEIVRRDGSREPVALADDQELLAEARSAASAWADAAGVALGGEPEVHTFDKTIGRQIAKGDS